MILKDIINPDFANNAAATETIENFNKFVVETGIISKKQAAIIALATAVTLKDNVLKQAILQEFSSDLDQTGIEAANTVGIIMTMSNIYFRAGHIMTNKEYATLPGYNMVKTSMASHGIDKKDFELACIAVSSINGCGLCLDSHENKAKAFGVSGEQIGHSIKVAAIIKSLSLLTK